MARDPNWKPEDKPRVREGVLATGLRSVVERLPTASGALSMLSNPAASASAYSRDLVTSGRGNLLPTLDDSKPKVQAQADAPVAKMEPFNSPASRVPSVMDFVGNPESDVAGTFNGRNGLRVVSRQQADAATTEAAPAPIDTSDTTDYAGITGRARQGIRGATLAARSDATRLVNPMSQEAEILRRAQNATGSYFNKGFPGARNAQVAALLGQLEAGNDASAQGASQEGEAELAGAGAQLQSGLNDRQARTEARYGLRGGAGAGGPDMGDMISLMQLEETKRANSSREGEAARGRTQERIDSLFGDPTKDPGALDKTNPTHRALAAFIVQSEEDPNFAASEEGMQTERRILNEIVSQVDSNKTFFSPETGGGVQTAGPASRLAGAAVDPDDDVGVRQFEPDIIKRWRGAPPGSLKFTTANGDTAAAPLEDVPLAQNPIFQQFLREASARYATEK